MSRGIYHLPATMAGSLKLNYDDNTFRAHIYKIQLESNLCGSYEIYTQLPNLISFVIIFILFFLSHYNSFYWLLVFLMF
jgi:hypothetical protein